MKKTVSLVLAIMMIVALVAAIPMTASAADGVMSGYTGNMTVRKTASTSAAKLTTVTAGTAVEVLAQTTKSGVKWYKIEVKGVTGYVKAEYVTLGSSSGSSTANEYEVRTNTMKIYKSRSGSSKLLATAKKGETVTLVTKYSSGWAKVKYGSTTGYCNFKSLTKSAGGSTAAAGEAKFATVTKPTYSVYTTKAQITELLNYHLSIFSTNFSFKVNVSNQSQVQNLLPAPKGDGIYGFLLSDKELAPAGKSSAVQWYFDAASKTVTANISYNSAGLVLKHLYDKTPISDAKATTLYNKVNSILKSEVKSGMSEYEVALALHDYICENVEYGTGTYSSIAYGALVEGSAACQGYAEATSLLYTAAGLENYIIRATNTETNVTHGYVKVKIDGKWYCVDTTGDDPMNNTNPAPRHDFFLTSDDVIEQRYQPWNSQFSYPAATSMTQNYYVKNNLVVSSMSEAKTLIQNAVKAKKASLEIWVDDYSSSKYSASTLKGYATSAGADSVTLKGLGYERSTLYFIFEY